MGRRGTLEIGRLCLGRRIQIFGFDILEHLQGRVLGLLMLSGMVERYTCIRIHRTHFPLKSRTECNEDARGHRRYGG